MEDSEIYELYWNRNEQAIVATHQKYGSWCRSIAHRILSSLEDTEECVSDTYLAVWNNIPPQRPNIFRAWLGKLTRNLALSRYRKLTAEKRGGGETPLVLEELQACVSGSDTPEQQLGRKEIIRIIEKFLDTQTLEKRNIFIRRYWYMEPIKDIAMVFHMSESKVRSILLRQRQGLKEMLIKEGVTP